jgi:thiosulfate dehydrogenase (quinone) large subunit
MSNYHLTSSDLSLAHALARLGLGINIATHGLARIGDISGFAASMEKMFAASWLPSVAVRAMAYCIPPFELTIGILLILGLFLRPVLVVGILFLYLLTFGSTLIQQWDVAGLQLIYIALYSVLLGTAGFDRFSVEAWRARAQPNLRS